MSHCGTTEDLITFPCDYTFKAVGVTGELFSAQVKAAVSSHALVRPGSLRIRQSKNRNYQSVSICVRVVNNQQVKDIYAEMYKISGLKMLL